MILSSSDRNLSGGARHGGPARAVGKLLEVIRDDVRLGQILRILDHLRKNDPLAVVEFLVNAEVLGHNCASAVRHTVFPVISRLHIRRDDFQIAATRLFSSQASITRAKARDYIGNQRTSECSRGL